ncbi:MAG: hypothetical protein MUD08_01320 [Cytophagales bacterium]|jgi:hypothetical protein|nr:hypothetical protein [Cytophagales bacterium]
MKTSRTLLILAIATITCTAWGQNTVSPDKGLARVQKMHGIEMYVMAEPLRAYEVLEEYRFSKAGTSFITGGLVNESAAQKLEKAARKAAERAGRSGKSVDAVVYTGGKRAVIVHFTEPPTDATRGIARVYKLQGREMYVMSEPLQQYEVAFTVLNGLKIKSAVTGGLVNNGVDEDINQYMSNAGLQSQQNGIPFDAVIYTGGKGAAAILFRNQSAAKGE